MDTELWLFGGVFLGSSILSMCPYLDGAFTPYGIGLMAVLGLIMFVQRLRYIYPGFVPRVGAKESAVVIIGCEQTPGFMIAGRCTGRGMQVFASVEDLQSGAAVFLRRRVTTHVLRFDPLSDTDAADAARFVRENLGSRVLTGVVYAPYPVPKETDTLDINDVRRSIEISAIGAIKVADAFASLLQEQNSRFIIIADLAGRVAIPSLQSYCISQTVALQFAEIIRKKFEKQNVSVHVVEQLLSNFKKTQVNDAFPNTNPIDGKVIMDIESDHLEHQPFMTMESTLQACLSKNPKARYLGSYMDMTMDKIIRYAPSCLRDLAVDVYFQSIPRRNNS